MSENTIELQIKKLEERRIKDEAKLRRLRARNRKAQRAADTRRKILLGGLLLKMMSTPQVRAKIRAELDKFLTKSADRKLFHERWWNSL